MPPPPPPVTVSYMKVLSSECRNLKMWKCHPASDSYGLMGFVCLKLCRSKHSCQNKAVFLFGVRGEIGDIGDDDDDDDDWSWIMSLVSNDGFYTNGDDDDDDDK